MREIKFRAWDKERKEMFPVTSMNWPEWWVSCEPILEGIIHPLDYGERNSFKNQETDRHILMQYTGLKDRNGKEIYEGDIIKGKRYSPNERLHKRFIGRVGFRPPAFQIDGVGQYEGFICEELHSAYEIIGNIYENSELIGG